MNIKRSIFNYVENRKRKLESIFFEEIFDIENSISLVDIGGYKGIQDRWRRVEKFVEFHAFEPNSVEADKIKSKTKSLNIYKSALSSTDGKIILNICKEPAVSSLLKLNFEFLKKFKNVERFEIIEKIEVEAKQLDSLKIDKIDFIKIDVQGYNLEVLKGSNKALEKAVGIEIECEFKEIYKNQSLFRDVDEYLSKHNFELCDFTDIVRWSEKVNDEKKQIDKIDNQGEIIFVNALYIKKNLQHEKIDTKKLKKIILIYLLYGQYSKALNLINYNENNLKISTKSRQAINKLIKSMIRMNNVNKLYLLLSKLFGSTFQTSILK